MGDRFTGCLGMQEVEAPWNMLLFYYWLSDDSIAFHDEEQAFADIGAVVRHALQFVGNP